MSDGDRRNERPVPAETAETLVWLLDTDGLDRGRYGIVNRLRAIRESDEFATLPEDLRRRIREIVAGAEP